MNWLHPKRLLAGIPDTAAVTVCSIRLRLDELPPLQDNQLFELTLEDDTGSPTGLPTGPIQFIGRAVEI